MSHPLHPALVHFPIASWSLATAADLLGLVIGAPAWQFAGLLHAIGTVSALVAMAAGFADLLALPPEHPALRDAQHHLLWVSLAWSAYAASLLLRLDGLSLRTPDAWALALSVAGFAALAVAGWLGGRLVYEHGVRVRR
ncbi:DUF2231 domain-containing protein [Tahibacter sp. UC22_41]|uniref:DUF2231 domain-containing protein n=1 Tax=Tahibacter sp. UC22_41 TaxID=3350178 RepID=UPI0036DEE28D